VPRPSKTAALILLAGIAISTGTLGGSLFYLEHLGPSDSVAGLASAAFALFGVALLLLSWQAGVLRRSGNRLRPASQPHLLLVRSAFAWLTFAGLYAIFAGVNGAMEPGLPGQFEFDAVRHALGLGLITMLIAGMSLMIVPEFAADRLHADQKLLAVSLFTLLNLATLLRVAPSIAGTAWSFDQRNLFMAIAGTLAEAALVLFAVSLFRLMRGGRGGGALTKDG
jgi:hypothetical protein